MLRRAGVAQLVEQRLVSVGRGFESRLRLGLAACRERSAAARSGVRERLLEVGPQLVDVLEADAEAQQAGRDAVALPAGARLEHRLRAAEARRVDDQPRPRLDPRAPLRRRRRRTRAARRSPDSARLLSRDGRPAGAQARVAVSVCRRTRTSSVRRPRSSSQHGSGAATIPVLERNVEQPLRVLLARAHDRAEQHVRVAAEVLRRAVHDEVGAVLERPQEHRRRGRRVDDDRGGMRRGGLQVGHRQERVRRRLQPDQVGVRAAAARSGRTRRSADPSARAPGRGRSCRSSSPRRARSSAPGEQNASTSAVAAPVPEAKSSAWPPSSSPSIDSASVCVGWP